MRSNLHRKSLSICRKLFPHGGLRAAATECSFVLVFCLCFFATSAAFGQCPMGNQIVNPGNEAAPLNFNGTQQGSAPSWTVTSGNFGGLSYGADFFGLEILPVAPPHSPGDRGNNVFYGGNAQTNSSATQVYNVPAACQAEINTPGINYSVSGWFGGYAGQDDRFRLVVTFRDATNAALATVTIGDVLAIERGNDSGLRLRNAFGRVPPGTTSILFTLESTYAATDVNNAYADSLAFIFVPTTAAAASLSGRVTNAGGRGGRRNEYQRLRLLPFSRSAGGHDLRRHGFVQNAHVRRTFAGNQFGRGADERRFCQPVNFRIGKLVRSSNFIFPCRPSRRGGRKANVARTAFRDSFSTPQIKDCGRELTFRARNLFRHFRKPVRPVL
jgi:hypothetical protein